MAVAFTPRPDELALRGKRTQRDLAEREAEMEAAAGVTLSPLSLSPPAHLPKATTANH